MRMRATDHIRTKGLERVKKRRGRKSHARRACEARVLHTRGSRLRRFPPSENVRKRLFCSLDIFILVNILVKVKFMIISLHMSSREKLLRKSTGMLLFVRRKVRLQYLWPETPKGRTCVKWRKMVVFIITLTWWKLW